MPVKHLVAAAGMALMMAPDAGAYAGTSGRYPVHGLTSNLRVDAKTCGPAGRIDPKTIARIKQGRMAPLRYFPSCRAVEFFDRDNQDTRIVLLIENLDLPRGNEPGANNWKRLLNIPESDPAMCLAAAGQANRGAQQESGAMGFGEIDSCAKQTEDGA